MALGKRGEFAKKKQDGRRLNRVQLDSDSKERKWEVSLGGKTVGQTAIWT